MTRETLLEPAQMDSWHHLAKLGVARAFSGLCEMTGQDIKVTSLTSKRVPLGKVVDLVGGSGAVTVGVYLSVTGSARGHMVLMYQPETACGLADLIMDRPIGTTTSLEDMELSALGEMGNIMGSFFLTAVAGATGLDLHPSPPSVKLDMAGAILDTLLGELIQEVELVLVLETTFSTQDRQIQGTFLVIPTPSFLSALLQAANAQS